MSDPSRTHIAPARVACFGELLMRLSPPSGELPLQSPRFEVHFGGAEANVAVSLALLGHDSAMISTLPDDMLGRACIGELRRHGVDTSGVRLGEGRVGLYFLAPGAMHRPSQVLYDRAGSAFARSPASAYAWQHLLERVQWLHLSGINLALGTATADASLSIVRAARAAGARISFDCNYRSTLWGARAPQAPELLREVVAEADLLFGDDRDIALILGGEFGQPHANDRFRAAADDAFAAWPRLQYMATTARSHRQADVQELAGLLATPEQLWTTPPRALEGIIDRIGAGDAFAAGLLHGLLKGMGDQAMLDFAAAAACLKHAVPGDANLMREADISALLAPGGYEVRR